MENTNKRQVYLDVLRVIACLSVVILHVSAQNWYTTDVNSFEWNTFNVYNSMVRWTVPVFVMISGALFLNKDISIEKIIKKYIFRLIIAFVFWDFFYAFYRKINGGLYNLIDYLLKGYYHMWFIFMIIGVYLSIPFLKLIVKEEKLIRYFLLLAFIFNYFIPTFVTVICDFAPEGVVEKVQDSNNNIGGISINMIMGYASYFILGYLINEIEIPKRKRILAYVLGVIGIISTIVLCKSASIKYHNACEHYYSNFRLNVLLSSIAIFIFIKQLSLKIKSEGVKKIIYKLSKNSFGVYMIHVYVMEKIEQNGINTLSFNPALSVLILSVVIFIISNFVILILSRIRLFSKYIL